MRKFAQRGGRIERGVIGGDGRDRGGSGQIAQQRSEAQLDVKIAQGVRIGLAARERFEIELDGSVGGDGGQLL